MRDITLPAIPCIDARQGGSAAIAGQQEDRLRDLFGRARRIYTPFLLGLADDASRRWLERSGNAYLGEMAEIATRLGRRGIYALNTSYEWCCTSGVGDDAEGGVRLLRVLDWWQPGLGRNLIVARQSGPAGDFLNITWPGFVGVITAQAPGRFAAAITQPPMMSWGLSWPVDWAVGRARVFRSSHALPAHLLRQVFESCATYDEAKRVLVETPLCIPAFFTLAGTEPGEGCVIERTQERAAVRDMPAAVANHWVALRERGCARGYKTRARLAIMEAALAGRGDWRVRPILNRDTRLVADMNPATGRLVIEGWERRGRVTACLTLNAA